MRYINRYTQERHISKFSVESNFAVYIAPQASVIDDNLCIKLLSLNKEKVSGLFIWLNGLFRGKIQEDANNSNFESAVYMKSEYTFKVTVTVKQAPCIPGYLDRIDSNTLSIKDNVQI